MDLRRQLVHCRRSCGSRHQQAPNLQTQSSNAEKQKEEGSLWQTAIQKESADCVTAHFVSQKKYQTVSLFLSRLYYFHDQEHGGKQSGCCKRC